jgi:hypothetical protein
MHVTIARNHPKSVSSALNPFASKNRRLWIAQSALAALFVFAGAAKLAMSSAALTADTWLSADFLRFIGVCEVLGAAGLILPGITGIRRGLTPLAAAGLVVIMIGATAVTVAAGDAGPAVFPALVGLLAAYVATGRGFQPEH